MTADIYVTVRRKGDDLELATTTDKVIEEILYPCGNGRIGVVLLNTKKHLGIEEKAVPVLQQLFQESECRPGCLGDIGWWGAGALLCFSWLGPNKVRWPIGTFHKACHTDDDAFRPDEFQML